jgi:hypothetical protein
MVPAGTAVKVSAWGPLLGAKLVASVPLTEIVKLLAGVLLDVETVNVDAPGAGPLSVTEGGLKEQPGPGLPPPVMLHERPMVPV